MPMRFHGQGYKERGRELSSLRAARVIRTRKLSDFCCQLFLAFVHARHCTLYPFWDTSEIVAAFADGDAALLAGSREFQALYPLPQGRAALSVSMADWGLDWRHKGVSGHRCRPPGECVSPLSDNVILMCPMCFHPKFPEPFRQRPLERQRSAGLAVLCTRALLSPAACAIGDCGEELRGRRVRRENRCRVY